jgi:hypothetical protein
VISLNTPIGRDGTAELGDLYGTRDTAAEAVDVADALARPLARLRPVERALVVAVHTGEVTIDEAAARLGKSPLAVTRLLKTAERKARGRKRSAGTPAPGAGREQPVGTVRVRKLTRGRARWIKVRMDGPPAKRWKLYATWLWEKHRGPVPRGKNVLHRDGDTLNDDLGNLILGGHADRAFLFQSRSEANFKRAMRACHAGAAKHNRERAAARDLAGELREGKWYAVDHDARTITGPLAHRSIRDAYAALGVPPPAAATSSSPRPWIAAQLGWPLLSCGEALTLAALAGRADHDWTRAELRVAVEAVADRIGRPMQVTDSFLNQFLYHCRRRGLVATTRRGTLGSVHRATPAALADRGTPCLLAVLRGRDCRTMKDDGYTVRPLAASGARS